MMPRTLKAVIEVQYPEDVTDEEINSLREGIRNGLMREIGNGILTNPEPHIEVDGYSVSVLEEV